MHFIEILEKKQSINCLNKSLQTNCILNCSRLEVLDEPFTQEMFIFHNSIVKQIIVNNKVEYSACHEQFSDSN